MASVLFRMAHQAMAMMYEREADRYGTSLSKITSTKGRKDFVTHKGDKDYNRRGHRQHKSKKSRKSLFAQLFGI